MKTTKLNFKPTIKSLLIVIILLSVMGLLVSIAFGIPIISPSNSLMSLTQEQYFYLGVINFIIALTCIRIVDSIRNVGKEENRNILTTSDKPNNLNRLYQWGKQVHLQYIDKNQIPQLKFSNEDVLSNEESMARERDLHRALYLGNSLKHKVKIFFKDKESIKYTETTIWDATHHHIYLKSGIMLPVKSVYKIEL